MRKALVTAMVWLSVLFVTESAIAVVYVPGEYRSDGIYVPPHFRGESERSPVHGWFEKMLESQSVEKDAKLPPEPGQARDGHPPKVITR